MSKLVYLIGAGASYGTRNSSKTGMDYYETGMPIMSEIKDYLDCYCKSLYPYCISFGEGRSTSPSHPHVYEELKWLRDIAKNNPTIDAYAKKLYVRGEIKDLERMKRALTIFFTLIQKEDKIDQRYDAFLEAFSNQEKKIPSEVSVLSWNYDHQFEYALHKYELTKTSETHQYMTEHISCKGFTSRFISYEDSNLVKLNGMAWFKPERDSYLYESQDNSLDRFERMLSAKSFTAHNFISYAWEEDNDFLETILPLTYDTEDLVIIGYSMPDVNHKVDSRLISGMRNLRSVTIQDKKNGEIVKDRLLETLPETKRNEIINNIRIIKDQDSFHIPRKYLQ